MKTLPPEERKIQRLAEVDAAAAVLRAYIDKGLASEDPEPAREAYAAFQKLRVEARREAIFDRHAAARIAELEAEKAALIADMNTATAGINALTEDVRQFRALIKGART
jgi:hypothetical protein